MAEWEPGGAPQAANLTRPAVARSEQSGAPQAANLPRPAAARSEQSGAPRAGNMSPSALPGVTPHLFRPERRGGPGRAPHVCRVGRRRHFRRRRCPRGSWRSSWWEAARRLLGMHTRGSGGTACRLPGRQRRRLRGQAHTEAGPRAECVWLNACRGVKLEQQGGGSVRRAAAQALVDRLGQRYVLGGGWLHSGWQSEAAAATGRRGHADERRAENTTAKAAEGLEMAAEQDWLKSRGRSRARGGSRISMVAQFVCTHSRTMERQCGASVEPVWSQCKASVEPVWSCRYPKPLEGRPGTTQYAWPLNGWVEPHPAFSHVLTCT
eukprot:349686-Chlamydomonas_euryale.AAC.2